MPRTRSTPATARSSSSPPSPTPPLPLRAARAVGEDDARRRAGAGHRRGRNQTTLPEPAQGSEQHPHRLLAALQGAARGARGRGRARPADRHRLHLRRPEPSGLRLAHQLRHSLEPGAHHPALRPHRPHRLAERAHPARQLLAQHGAGGVHQPGAARQRPHGAARHLRHRRGEPHRAAVRQPDERSGIPPQAAAQAAGRRHRPRRPLQRRLHRRPDADRLPHRPRAISSSTSRRASTAAWKGAARRRSAR